MSVRLTIPFAVWSHAVDTGGLAEVRAWLAEVERRLDAEMARRIRELSIYGYTPVD